MVGTTRQRHENATTNRGALIWNNAGSPDPPDYCLLCLEWAAGVYAGTLVVSMAHQQACTISETAV